MGNFSHFARWEFFPAGLFSHGKKFLWDFSKMVSVAQMSYNCDLDSIICILLHLPIPPLTPLTPPPSTRTYNFQATLGGPPLAELLYKSVACLNILTYVNVGGFHHVKHQKQMNGWGDRVCVCSWGGWVGRRGVGILAVKPDNAYFRLESHGIFVSRILGTFLFSV